MPKKIIPTKRKYRKYRKNRKKRTKKKAPHNTQRRTRVNQINSYIYYRQRCCIQAIIWIYLNNREAAI